MRPCAGRRCRHRCGPRSWVADKRRGRSEQFEDRPGGLSTCLLAQPSHREPARSIHGHNEKERALCRPGPGDVDVVEVDRIAFEARLTRPVTVHVRKPRASSPRQTCPQARPRGCGIAGCKAGRQPSSESNVWRRMTMASSLEDQTNLEGGGRRKERRTQPASEFLPASVHHRCPTCDQWTVVIEAIVTQGQTSGRPRVRRGCPHQTARRPPRAGHHPRRM